MPSLTQGRESLINSIWKRQLGKQKNSNILQRKIKYESYYKIPSIQMAGV